VACVLLSRHFIPLERIALPAMNFDQEWRYPESAYELYTCIVHVNEAVELLQDDLDDIFASMREDAEERLVKNNCLSDTSNELASLGWPTWQSLPIRRLAEVLAVESALDLLLKLEMKHATRPCTMHCSLISSVQPATNKESGKSILNMPISDVITTAWVTPWFGVSPRSGALV